MSTTDLAHVTLHTINQWSLRTKTGTVHSRMSQTNPLKMLQRSSGSWALVGVMPGWRPVLSFSGTQLSSRTVVSNRKAVRRRLIALISLLLMVIVAASAQVSTTTITGVVTDPSDARLPGVQLTLSNTDTGVTSTASTDKVGEYTFSYLPPGRYQLAAQVAGFRTYTQPDIVLEMGRVVRLDVRFQVGEVAESVVVSGGVPLLESETSTVGQFIEHKTIVDMPLNGRKVGDLLQLTGHSVYISGGIVRPRMAVAGGRADQQQWLMDGVNSSNQPMDISQALFNPPVEAVQEMRVQQSSYSAEFGNSSSGVVIISTKSGTNQLHGSLYEFLRNDKLDATNYFAQRRPPLRFNVFGFSAGGPIIRNRTFFFSSTEWSRQRVGAVQLFTVPTPEQLRGDFSNAVDAAGRLIPIYDPATSRPDPNDPLRTIRTVFAGNVIPDSQIDPVARNITAVYPGPNRAGTNLAGANNFSRNNVSINNIATWTSKVDHVFTDNDRMSARFILHDFPSETTPVFDLAAADPFAFRAVPRAYSLLLNEVHSFTPRLINDFRFNWQPRRFERILPSSDEGWPGRLGLRGVAERAFPRITATGFTPLGSANHGDVQKPIRDTHIVNHTSWFQSGHSVKFGGEVRLGRFQGDSDQLVSGSLTFNAQPTALPGVNGTGHPIASLLVGFPNRGDIVNPDLIDRGTKYFALFVNDDWKVTPNFTLNLGIRWEAHTPRTDTNNRQNGFDPYAINPVSGTPGVVTFAGRGGLGSALYNGDYNNLAPRVGWAWRPFGNGRTVVRAAYGIFFGPPLPGCCNSTAGFESSGEFTSPDNGVTAPFRLRDGFPALPARSELGPGFGAVPVGQQVRYSPQFIAPDRQLGYSQQWNFGIQRELGLNAVVELSYLGNVGHKLPGFTLGPVGTSINQVRPELMGPGNAQMRRPFPQFGDVVMVTPMWGNSNYHGLNIKVEKRFSHGLNFLANYTFSKFIDDVPTLFEAGDIRNDRQNLYDAKAERSLSGNDVRSRFVWSSVYELPVGKDRHWLRQGAAAMIIGGWNLGTLITLQSGSPYGMITQTNTTNAFAPGPQRVNILYSPELPKSERRRERYFDTGAVEAPQAFTFGNAARAVGTGPGLINMDASLLKDHRWGESYNLQFRFEAFNLANHPNFEEPNGVFGSPQFGIISRARDARILQLGLRLEF